MSPMALTWVRGKEGGASVEPKGKGGFETRLDGHLSGGGANGVVKPAGVRLDEPLGSLRTEGRSCLGPSWAPHAFLLCLFSSQNAELRESDLRPVRLPLGDREGAGLDDLLRTPSQL